MFYEFICINSWDNTWVHVWNSQKMLVRLSQADSHFNKDGWERAKSAVFIAEDSTSWYSNWGSGARQPGPATVCCSFCFWSTQLAARSATMKTLRLSIRVWLGQALTAHTAGGSLPLLQSHSQPLPCLFGKTTVLNCCQYPLFGKTAVPIPLLNWLHALRPLILSPRFQSTNLNVVTLSSDCRARAWVCRQLQYFHFGISPIRHPTLVSSWLRHVTGLQVWHFE